MSAWGPTPANDGTTFRLWAPDADRVTLEIDGAAPTAMDGQADGWFTATADVGAGVRYRFRICEELAVPDPASRQQSGVCMAGASPSIPLRIAGNRPTGAGGAGRNW
ncbi:hypothetical protein QTN93_03695 [Sphingomonas aerolata]|uniref:hypothetical protein n=1 Tax=Sphingomonas aerolata TaxID=185951 RepID=UPI0035A65390